MARRRTRIALGWGGVLMKGKDKRSRGRYKVLHSPDGFVHDGAEPGGCRGGEVIH